MFFLEMFNHKFENLTKKEKENADNSIKSMFVLASASIVCLFLLKFTRDIYYLALIPIFAMFFVAYNQVLENLKLKNGLIGYFKNSISEIVFSCFLKNHRLSKFHTAKLRL